MSRATLLCVILCVSLPVPLGLGAQSPSAAQVPQQAGAEATTLAELRAQLNALRTEYDKRIKDLETRLEELQIQMLRGAAEPQETVSAPPQAAPAAYTPAALNPAISVVGNFLGRIDDRKLFNESGSRIDNRFNLREVEIDLRTAIDPYADAVVIASLGSENPGQYEASIEEGYANIRRLPFLEQPPLGLKLKIGRFRPAFGKVNILHTHDLPQSFRPLPVEEFLGEEGFVQNGASASFFLPMPLDEGSSLDATIEVLGGGGIAVSPDIEGRNAYLGHLRWFRTFRDTHSLELGWSTYYGPAHHQAGVKLHGVDLSYRWKPFRQGEWKSFLFGGELMFARDARPALADPAVAGAESGRRSPLGFTLFGQWQFDRRKYAGVRYDSTDVLTDPSLERHSVTPYFSYYFSEFLRFRLNVEHRWSNLNLEARRSSVFGELNFVFGAHPPEPYWVNR